jgi:hypothetical protein
MKVGIKMQKLHLGSGDLETCICNYVIGQNFIEKLVTSIFIWRSWTYSYIRWHLKDIKAIFITFIDDDSVDSSEIVSLN